LDAIHFGEIVRSYNCENIANFYVCKYIYKYSGEIVHLIGHLDKLENLERYDVLSVGCGPCTELAGLRAFLSQRGLNRPINFLGVDLNDVWRPIHERIRLTSQPGCFIDFSYGDALKVLPSLNWQNIDWRPNMVVMQYFISSVVNSGGDLGTLVTELSASVFPIMPINSFLVLNDINHFSIRVHFESIQSAMARRYKTEEHRLHFKHNVLPYYQYGQQHPSNEIKSEVPPEIDECYHPWKFCSSAQMVIEKRS